MQKRWCMYFLIRRISDYIHSVLEPGPPVTPLEAHLLHQTFPTLPSTRHNKKGSNIMITTVSDS